MAVVEMQPYSLNIGSGQRPFARPFLNVDCQEKWQPDIVARAEYLPKPMFSDNTADYVVAHHVLEHYGCNEGAGLVREAFRVLKPWGSLLVFVPDIRALAQMFLSGELDEETYMISLYGAYMGDEADRHKFGFTHSTLRRFLQATVPWRAVMDFDWRVIPGADLARDKWILAMEAVK